jgi:hypothetical protein
MVMGEVNLCRVKELPPIFAGELRPALADDSAALFVARVPHESLVTAWVSVLLLVVRGPRLATHQKAVIGALANRFHNVSKSMVGWRAPAAG